MAAAREGAAPCFWPLRDSDRPAAATSRFRATAPRPPPPCRFSSRASVAPPSAARLSAFASIESYDITVLPFASQINNGSITPADDDAFKAEVIFCVQGAISPLLSVIYMNRFLKHWRLSGRREAFHGQIISYADDFVILSRGHAEDALTWTKAVMTKLGLTLNETKTSVKNARLESFDFLGYTLGPRHFRNGGRWYLGAAPSKKSVLRIKRKVSELLTPGNKGAWLEVQARLNRLLRGWSAYFSYGSLATAHQAVDRHVFDRVLAFLRRRHKTPGRGVRWFSDQIYGNPGVLVLNRVRKVSPTCAL
ncbi:group II intron maturase-specific domain-containing protein [Bradyrhizobium japonicum]|uniref:group II intron maturase-specific domain-containing protein n=1 Tax=Bradyrhizobium japonicum TaxID=375 RepID=UPI001CB70F16|nr:group II intron maturase-specific domain-containing protein [Bradyrhizobium japonicum]